MDRLIGSGLRFGRLILAGAIGLLLFGTAQVRSAKVDLYPEFAAPTVQVQTEAPGLSGAEVEQLLTVPLEVDLLNGVPWLDHLHSRSEAGLSAIDLVFRRGTDLYAARQMVQERLTTAHAIPNVGSPPVMVQPVAASSRVAMLGLSSTRMSLIDLSVQARWKIRPRLMGVPGVANVVIFGQRDRQLQVQVDPARLAARNVSLTQVIETAGNALWVSPLTFVQASTPGTGGFLEGADQRLAVQHVLPITTATNLAQVPVVGTRPGSLRLGDITQVIEDHQPLIGDALGTTGPMLYLVVQKFPGADTRAVARGVQGALSGMRPELTGIAVDSSVYRPADQLSAGLSSLGLIGLIGLLLLAALLLATFRSWRVALIALVAVPLSLLAAVTTLVLLGQTLTLMTLAGLLVAVALVVDDVVGEVHAIAVRLRDREEFGEPIPIGDAVTQACAQARGTLVSATVVVLLATLPVLVLSPAVVAFTRSMVVGYALALLASVLVTLFVTPALAVLLLAGRPALVSPSRFERWLDDRADGAVNTLIAIPQPAWIPVALIAVGTLIAIPQLQHPSWLPQTQDRNLVLRLQAPPGTSLPETDRVASRIGAELRGLPGVQAVGAQIGRAVTGDQFGDVDSGELWITLTRNADYRATRARIEAIARGYAGIRAWLDSYPVDQVRHQAAASGDAGGHDLVVRVFGQDETAMQSTATRIGVALQRIPGVATALVDRPAVSPVAQLEVDLGAAQRYGLRPGDIRREATTLSSGLIVGNLYDQSKVFDVVVVGSPAVRTDPATLGALLIGTPSGRPVRLRDVARITMAMQPTTIVRDEAFRSLDVVVTVSGRSASAVLDDARAAVAAVPLPEDLHTQVLGAAVSAGTDRGRAFGYLAGLLLLVLTLLQLATGSWRRAFVLLLALPLGGTGAVLVAPVVGGLAGTGALAGLFAAIAITVRSGLALVRQIAVLERIDGRAADRPAATAAARLRAVPMVASALATSALLLPGVLLGGRAGIDLLRPFAVTLLGGSVSSTVVVLLLVPALCARPATSPPRRR
jgi:Cu/Ag efflux pump CusA